jgi:hypothetical protein
MATSAAAISSLPRCAATPECPMALESAASARFGGGIFAFGAFVMKAIGRHLARGAHEGAAVQQPVGLQQSSEMLPAAILEAELEALEAELEALEADACAFRLGDPAGIGQAQESSSARDQLKAMLERCGGLERLDASIYGLLEHVHTKVAGGLLYNWLQIGFSSSDGSLGVHCLSCNKGRGLAIGCSGHAGSTQPFSSTMKHLAGKQHEKARDAAIQAPRDGRARHAVSEAFNPRAARLYILGGRMA